MTFGQFLCRPANVSGFSGGGAENLDILIQALLHSRFDILDHLHLPAEILGVTHCLEFNVPALEKTYAHPFTLPLRSYLVAKGHRRTRKLLLPVDGRKCLHRLLQPFAAFLPILLAGPCL